MKRTKKMIQLSFKYYFYLLIYSGNKKDLK